VNYAVLPILMSGAQRKSLRSWQPRKPVVRLSALMHDRNDQYWIHVGHINNTLRKPRKEPASNARINGQPSVRISEDALNRCANFHHEVRFQTCHLSLVELNRFAQFGACSRMKREASAQRVRSLNSSNTCSPGMGMTAPERNSATRRRTSVNQACSISESSSRLAMSRSARRARSTRGRSSAIDSTCSISASCGFIFMGYSRQILANKYYITVRGKVGMGCVGLARSADTGRWRHMPETLVPTKLSEVCRLGPALRLKLGTSHHKEANDEHRE
jgi:hypothetical protein